MTDGLRSAETRQPDYVLTGVVLTLLGIGLVMVFSSSTVMAGELYEDPFYFLKRQGIFAALGLFGMWIASKVPYTVWRRWAGPLFALNIVLLVLVVIPGIGTTAADGVARRWIELGPLSFQPSEFAKLATIIFLARWLADTRQPPLAQFVPGLLPKLGVLVVVFALLMLEPDLGTALAVAGTFVIVLLLAGARLLHLSMLALPAAAAVALLIVQAPYRMRRITSFLDPFADPQASGYHIIQSLYALGTGGPFGIGLGNSRQKFFYLPELHTDFIFAILGEELGLLGGAVVILLFMVLAWRGFIIAATAPDAFSGLLAAGLTAMIVIQAVINIGVVTSSMPVTGIPLPFVSYGGTSLLFSLGGVGILLSISREVRR